MPLPFPHAECPSPTLCKYTQDIKNKHAGKFDICTECLKYKYETKKN